MKRSEIKTFNDLIKKLYKEAAKLEEKASKEYERDMFRDDSGYVARLEGEASGLFSAAHRLEERLCVLIAKDIRKEMKKDKK
jgi:hypothetical protein